MLNARQEADSKECDINEDKDCMGCSCSVCLAQIPKDYKTGLKRALDIMDKEFDDTEELNQVKVRLEKEIKKQ